METTGGRLECRDGGLGCLQSVSDPALCSHLIVFFKFLLDSS